MDWERENSFRKIRWEGAVFDDQVFADRMLTWKEEIELARSLCGKGGVRGMGGVVFEAVMGGLRLSPMILLGQKAPRGEPPDHDRCCG